MSTVQDPSAVTNLFGAAAAKKEKSSAEETEHRFLSLLVAQMKNQDPLNPLDNAQVTSQMAQLSTVQGIENMKDRLAYQRRIACKRRRPQKGHLSTEAARHCGNFFAVCGNDDAVNSTGTQSHTDGIADERQSAQLPYVLAGKPL